MSLGMEVGLGPGDILLYGIQHVRWGPSSTPKGHSPQFSAHVCCAQTAGWIKMPIGTKVGLGPGHIVLDGAQLPQRGTAPPPIFGPCLLWPNGRPSQLLLSTCIFMRISVRELTGFVNKTNELWIVVLSEKAMFCVIL